MTVPPDMRVALQVMTALILFSAAAGKVRNWRAFHGVLADYRLLPAWLALPVAYLLPPAEAAIGLWLLTSGALPWGATAAACMLALFAVAMAINLARGRRTIDCGCFQSTLKQTLRWRLVARNAVVALMLLAIAGAAPGARVAATSLINGSLAGVALFVVWQGMNTLWSILPAYRPLRAPLHAHLKE